MFLQKLRAYLKYMYSCNKYWQNAQNLTWLVAHDISTNLTANVHYLPFLHQVIALKELWKMLFISSKSFFHSQDIQIFVFLTCPLFPSVSHCLRRWPKINPKVYDIINCLYKNLNCLIYWKGRALGLMLKLGQLMEY